MILGYLLERTETISNHRGYAFKLSQDLSNKSLDWRTLLKDQDKIEGGTLQVQTASIRFRF